MTQTRDVELRRGIQVGETRHRLAVLREQTVEDVLEANRARQSDGLALAPSANEASVALIARRLIRLGSLEQQDLGPLIVRQLAVDDFARLDEACEAMDKELAAWISEGERARLEAEKAAKGSAGTADSGGDSRGR